MVLAIQSRFLSLLSEGRGSSGQTLVEYSLLLAFVASMVIAIAVLVGGTGGLLDDIGQALTDALG